MAVRNLQDAHDRDLARRVGEGDEEAFRSLFRRYGPVAKALALRVIRQPFMAEEIVQEAFLVLWRNPTSYREERGSFRSWLLSTVHHRAVDSVRREEAQRRRTNDWGEVAHGGDIADAVAHDVDLASERIQIRGALAEIPPDQRRVLELMYFEGKSQAQVAAELGLPLGTVKSRTLLGMRRLRTILAVETP